MSCKHRDPGAHPTLRDLGDPDASAMPAGGDEDGLSRRGFLGLSLLALPAVGVAGSAAPDAQQARTLSPFDASGSSAPPAPPADGAPAAQPPAAAVAGRAADLPDGQLTVTLHVNGERRQLAIDPRTTLLDALREQLALPGAKKGCDHGQCGACTVLVDDRRVLSCLLLAAMAAGRRVTTIEGLAQGEALHPVQAAFLEHDALQCGYCTPGQILSAVGLLREGCPADRAGIAERMSGNLCRCGAYPGIVAAIAAVRGGNPG